MKNILKSAGVAMMMLGAAFLASCNKADDTALGLPSNPMARGLKPTEATLEWTAAEGAQGYEVKLNDGAPVATGGNSYVATGLTPSTRYTWSVRATRGDKASEWVEGRAFTTTSESAVPLDTPVNLVVEVQANGDVSFTWDAVAEAVYYKIRIDGRETSQQLTQPAAYLNGFDPSSTHTWAVKAVNGERESVWAEGDGFTLPAAQMLPPSNLRVQQLRSTSAVILWDAVPYADGYEVQIDDIEPAVSEINGRQLSLDPETTYTWRVRTVMGDRRSDWVEGTPFTTPATVAWDFNALFAPGKTSGDYAATGTPTYPRKGLSSWECWIQQARERNSGELIPDTYAVVNPFGEGGAVPNPQGSLVMFLKVIDGRLYIDDNYIVGWFYTNAEKTHNEAGMVGAATLDRSRIVPRGQERLEVVWDPAAKTLTFPTIISDMEVMVGVLQYPCNQATGEVAPDAVPTENIGTEFYTNLVLTLSE